MRIDAWGGSSTVSPLGLIPAKFILPRRPLRPFTHDMHEKEGHSLPGFRRRVWKPGWEKLLLCTSTLASVKVLTDMWIQLLYSTNFSRVIILWFLWFWKIHEFFSHEKIYIEPHPFKLWKSRVQNCNCQTDSSPYALWPSIATFKVEKGGLPNPHGPLLHRSSSC